MTGRQANIILELARRINDKEVSKEHVLKMFQRTMNAKRFDEFQKGLETALKA